jgi:hypothetical protein
MVHGCYESVVANESQWLQWKVTGCSGLKMIAMEDTISSRKVNGSN